MSRMMFAGGDERSSVVLREAMGIYMFSYVRHSPTSKAWESNEGEKYCVYFGYSASGSFDRIYFTKTYYQQSAMFLYP